MTLMSSALISPQSMRPLSNSALMCASFASSCRKNVSHWYEMSVSELPPYLRCSSVLPSPPPPEKANLLTFEEICFFVSVQKMAEVSSLADILDCAPCSAGKNLEWISAGLRKPSFGARAQRAPHSQRSRRGKTLR